MKIDKNIYSNRKMQMLWCWALCAFSHTQTERALSEYKENFSLQSLITHIYEYLIIEIISLLHLSNITFKSQPNYGNFFARRWLNKNNSKPYKLRVLMKRRKKWWLNGCWYNQLITAALWYLSTVNSHSRWIASFYFKLVYRLFCISLFMIDVARHEPNKKLKDPIEFDKNMNAQHTLFLRRS